MKQYGIKSIIVLWGLSILTTALFILRSSPVRAFVDPFNPSLYAQNSEYPIPELGSCTDAESCSQFCRLPQNHAACWSYETYRRGQILGKTTEVRDIDAVIKQNLEAQGANFPIPDLNNCKDVRQCRLYCNDLDHFDICQEFAQKHGLTGNMTNYDVIQMKLLLEDAKNELGCDDKTECKKLCDTKPEKCQSFFDSSQILKLRIRLELLMAKAKTVLGCSNFSSCLDICEKNKNLCNAFVQKYNVAEPENESSVIQDNYFGTKSCQTASGCRAYCEMNPSDCPGFRRTELKQLDSAAPSRQAAQVSE